MFDSEQLFVHDSAAWRVDPVIGQGGTSSPVSGIDYNADGSLVAFSNVPADVQIVTSYDGKYLATLKQSYTEYAIVGLRFHPCDDSLLLSAHRDGYIVLHNILTGDVKHMTRHLGSYIDCMNVDVFGDSFAIACADGSIRLYDFANLQRTKALVKMTNKNTASGSSKVHALAFNPEDSNVILSASGDDKVLFWDVRTGNTERTIRGPHIRGSALDIRDGVILTGSARERKQLELWDYGKGERITDVPIDPLFAERGLSVNTARIARNGLCIIAGGSGSNICQGFDYSTKLFIGRSQGGQTSPVAHCAVSPFGASFIEGSEDGLLRCYMIRLRTV